MADSSTCKMKKKTKDVLELGGATLTGMAAGAFLGNMVGPVGAVGGAAAGGVLGYSDMKEYLDKSKRRKHCF